MTEQQEQLTCELRDLEMQLDSLYTFLYPEGEPHSREELTRLHKLEIQSHIEKLHIYNETKDGCMKLIGLIAQSRNVPIGDIMDEIGVGID